MKNFKMFLVVALFAMSTVLTASTNPTLDEKPTTLSTQVSKLLANPGFEVDTAIEADVTLMVNDNNELVVVSVKTEDEDIANFIKSRLNYKKVEVIQSKETFHLPVRIVPGE
tara:strand:- start:808 stop:1143 length:336 start_codon:yes stop_codon:yes gene_type:complete